MFTEEFSDVERKSLMALDSFRDFLRDSFDESLHTDAVVGIFRELQNSAEMVARKLLICDGALSDDVRSLLKGIILNQHDFNKSIGGFTSWSYRVTPEEIRNAFKSTGGMGYPTNNELALVINELRYNEVTRSDDYRFLKVLLDNSDDILNRTANVYSSDSPERKLVIDQRSAQMTIDALTEIYSADTSAITRGFNAWKGC